MSDYVRITDRKIELTDEGVEALVSDYTPTTEDVRREYAIAREGIESPDQVVAQFDRWLAEVKAERDKHIISLIKKDCEHAKFGDYCIHDHLIGEIEAQL